MRGVRRAAVHATASASVAIIALLVAIASSDVASRWREAAADIILAASPPRSDRLVVVDIDGNSLRAIGPWPWPRARLNELLTRISGGEPRAIAIDILLSDPDRTSPAILAGILDVPQPLREALKALPDPELNLAKSLATMPTVLAMLLTDDRGASPPSIPLVVSGAPPRLNPWSAEGAVVPRPALAAATALGVASLAEEEGRIVRRVPLFALAGESVVAGLAAETLRVAEGAGSFVMRAGENSIDIGDLRLPLTSDVSLRIRPTGPEAWAARSVSARAILSGEQTAEIFRGKIVLIGGGAPELGGLRATAASAIVPSVQIQADALATALSDRIPVRPTTAWLAETAAFILLSAIGVALGALAAPLSAAVVSFTAAAAWVAGSSIAVAGLGWVIDPVTPAVGGLLAVLVSGATSAISVRRREVALRQRFEQHLDPAVVSRIVENPDLLRLGGERREVTALFTDIEGFTALTDRIEPEELISLLDNYFAGVVEIIVRHGGMVDKFVGDAVHAFFNAPLDLPDHPRKALDAAFEIIDFTTRLSAGQIETAAGLGRTRIGIETGLVVIGDVGAGGKLDYTAHGSAVNTAARLEAMNKVFGTSICVGPVCRSRLPNQPFLCLGETEIAGRGLLEIFAPQTP